MGVIMLADPTQQMRRLVEFASDVTRLADERQDTPIPEPGRLGHAPLAARHWLSHSAALAAGVGRAGFFSDGAPAHCALAPGRGCQTPRWVSP
jgi:hypothetical protein